MSFSDIFKKSFLEGYASSSLSVKSVLVCMLVTVLIASYIFIVYRLLNRNSFYNKNFNIALPALAVITAAIILTIQSSIVISLGMVGALSIVRFRTAIKEPMDLVFLFWAISAGIICGAGLYTLAIITSLVITLAIFILDLIPVTKAPMLLIVNTSDLDGEDAVLNIVKKYSKYYRVKSRNVSMDELDMVVEVRVKQESALIKEVRVLEGMSHVSLLSHDGETTY